jgi:hypothetical protein
VPVTPDGVITQHFTIPDDGTPTFEPPLAIDAV